MPLVASPRVRKKSTELPRWNGRNTRVKETKENNRAARVPLIRCPPMSRKHSELPRRIARHTREILRWKNQDHNCRSARAAARATKICPIDDRLYLFGEGFLSSNLILSRSSAADDESPCSSDIFARSSSAFRSSSDDGIGNCSSSISMPSICAFDSLKFLRLNSPVASSIRTSSIRREDRSSRVDNSDEA